MEWGYLIVMALSFIISMALAPKPTVPEVPTLEDFDFPQVEEGTPQMVIFGEVWTGGWMVLNYGNYRTTEIVQEGKK